MKSKRGFTLIELIMVIVLISMIGAMTGLLLRQTFKSFYTGKKIVDLTIKTNLAAHTLMRELKNAESLSAVGTTTLTYLNHKGETVVVDLNGANLRRNVNSAGAQTLCNQVSGLTFSFFDDTLTTTAVPANVRFVTMQLTTQNELPYSLMASTLLRRLLP